MNMQSSSQSAGSRCHFLFLLSLFGAFCICALSVTLLGARIYQKQAESSQISYELNTPLSYVREKLRQNDRTGCIDLIEVEQTPVLSVKSGADSDFATWIYYQDGSLWELFFESQNPLPLSAGQRLLSVTDFYMEKKSDSQYFFRAYGADGSSLELTVTLSSSAS